MRAQANNLAIFQKIKYGVHAPSSQLSVCAFSIGEMWLQLPVDSTSVNARTVADGGRYRPRVRIVIDP